jgi:hypothetical protein
LTCSTDGGAAGAGTGITAGPFPVADRR